MTLSLDAVAIGTPEVEAAQVFYKTAFSPAADADGRQVTLDLHGAGQVELHGADALATDAGAESATMGFRGYVLNLIVGQPSEVETLLDAAVQGGAKVLKPAKKGLFGGFSAVYRAPDGAIWKLSAPTKKDTGPAADPPRATEFVTLLGVAEPKAAKAFYESLGMTADRDYGNKFVDFSLVAGKPRLGLMPRKALAKDAGVDEDGTGFRSLVLHHRVGSREEVDSALASAVSAGGEIAAAAGEARSGEYAGHFTDPDGFLWRVTAA